MWSWRFLGEILRGTKTWMFPQILHSSNLFIYIINKYIYWFIYIFIWTFKINILKSEIHWKWENVEWGLEAVMLSVVLQSLMSPSSSSLVNGDEKYNDSFPCTTSIHDIPSTVIPNGLCGDDLWLLLSGCFSFSSWVWRAQARCSSGKTRKHLKMKQTWIVSSITHWQSSKLDIHDGINCPWRPKWSSPSQSFLGVHDSLILYDVSFLTLWFHVHNREEVGKQILDKCKGKRTNNKRGINNLIEFWKSGLAT